MNLKKLRPIAANDNLMDAARKLSKADFDYSRTEDPKKYREGQVSVERYMAAYKQCNGFEQITLDNIQKKERDIYTEYELSVWLLATKNTYSQFYQVLEDKRYSVLLYAAKHDLVRFEADQIINSIIQITKCLKVINETFPDLGSMVLNLKDDERDNEAKKNPSLYRSIYKLKMYVKFFFSYFSNITDAAEHLKLNYPNSFLDKSGITIGKIRFNF